MKNIHIFGISTPVGQAFREKFCKLHQNNNIFLYSRLGDPYIKYDLDNPNWSISERLNLNSKIVSFAPIWSIANFLKYLENYDKKIFENIDSIIVISSTSLITKKFSSNDFDKNLYTKLNYAEKYITDLSNKFNFNLSIIRPTLIYGGINNYSDQNISRIGKLMKIIPIVFIPKNTGMRQPIHIKQLSEVVFHIYDLFKENKENKYTKIFEVGGDRTLSYFEMICLIKENLIKTKKIKFCKIIKVPNKLFYLFTFPLYLISPKFFDSLVRIQVDLCGFPSCSNIINKKSLQFPVENI